MLANRLYQFRFALKHPMRHARCYTCSGVWTHQLTARIVSTFSEPCVYKMKVNSIELCVCCV